MDHYVAPRKTLLMAGLLLLAFFSFGMWSVLNSLKPLFWKTVPCEVVQFEVTDHPHNEEPFGASVRFTFAVDGAHDQGDQLGISGWKHSRDAWAMAERFMDEPQTTCYLPDGDPEQACLLRPPVQWGGLAFVGFALGVGWILFIADRNRSSSSGQLFRHIALPLGCLFGVPGALLLWHFSLPVWVESAQVGGWKEVPATIEWSEIRTTRTENGTKENADICYAYRAGGREWRQNHLFPGGAAPISSEANRRLVNRHQSGVETTCLVDPDDPGRSVLFASIGFGWIWSLFPLPFLAVGLWCLRVRLRRAG